MSGFQRVTVVLACVSASMLGSCGAVDERASGDTPGNGDATKEAGAVETFRKKILVDGWEPVGLSGGGGMFTPAYSPIVPGLVMLSCDMGAEYLSRDGGRTWRMIPFRKLRANIRCTPAFHPTDPDVIVFGAPDGTIMVSRDQGENWQSLGKIAGRCRGAVVFDYDNPELMLVGNVDGAWISRDGGKSWTKCTGPKGAAVGFHVDRTSPVKVRRLFAATRQGVWRSDDGGATWTEKSAGLPAPGIRSFAGASSPP